MTSQTQSVHLERVHALLAEGVAALASEPGWRAWLDTAAQLPAYSVRNQLLLMAQRPGLTMAAGYRKWAELGRTVNKGEKALRILAPRTKRIEETNEKGDLDKRTIITGFVPVPVFALDQTDGDPLPVLPRPVLLEGQAPPGMWEALAHQVEAHGYRLSRCNSAADIGGANGMTDFLAREVRIRRDVSDAQAVKTLAHELGHVLLHSPDRPTAGNEYLFRPTCRGLIEVEAESVAYLVSAAHGLDTSDYTFGYIAGWMPDPEAIMVTAERVRATAGAILDGISPPIPAPNTTTLAPPPFHQAAPGNNLPAPSTPIQSLSI